MINDRQKLSMNDDWSFHLGDTPKNELITHSDIYNASMAGGQNGPAGTSYFEKKWQTISIPHDYMFEQNTDKNGAADWGYRPQNSAWYRKCFYIDEKYKDNSFVLEFEGIATECTVYFNGSIIKRNFSAYNSFNVDITDRINFNSPNVLAVFIHKEAFEGWWYEGQGIYRSVWLNILPPIHFSEEPYITYIKQSDSDWLVNITGQITGDCNGKNIVVRKTIKDYLGKTIAEFDGQSVVIKNPRVWDIKTPTLYELLTVIYVDGIKQDSFSSMFGFRTIEIKADKGFFLNGRQVKIKGTCNHQDFAGIGVAVPDSVWEYKIKRLKAMGCNSYRSAHGMASNGLVKACDKLGMLLMDENRSFETSEDCLEQLKAMVKRDRNHPSVVFYSIFNEEPLQSAPQGRKMAVHMMKEIRRLDNTRFITAAMHSGIFEENGVSSCLDIAGINYQINDYDKFHSKYPNIPVIATETASSFQVRGCTLTDSDKHVFSCYDEDSSDWGNNIRETLSAADAKEFLAGTYLWTGFDYFGEPSPHTYPSVSSFFGMLDTCGFEKGGFYLTKAIWSENPYISLLPHWNFNDGEIVKVMSCTNCEEAELYVNGISKGRVSIDKYKQHIWEIPFEKGSIKLVGFNAGAEVNSFSVKTAGAISKFLLLPAFDAFTDEIKAIPVKITALDEEGNEVPYADNLVTLSISGGKILGAANGNPNFTDSFKSKSINLFAGKALVVISPNKDMKNVMLKAVAEGLSKVRLTIPVNMSDDMLSIPPVKEMYISGWRMSRVFEQKPDANMTISDSDMNTWTSVAVENGAPSIWNGEIGKYVLYRISATVPDEINGRTPVLHFDKIWGVGEVYVNGELKETFSHEWSNELDVLLSGGNAEITVLIRCDNKYGAGICSYAIIR